MRENRSSSFSDKSGINHGPDVGPRERCPDKTHTAVAGIDAFTRWFHFQARGPLRNNLRGPMENARVERRQFHSMSFGQFGKVQIGKLSARFRGDSLR